MSLSEVDRLLLQRCLDQAPRAWQDFVDRFLGLVVHVANHTSQSRGITIDRATRDDLVAEVFLTLVGNDFAVLRRFRRNCSLATYLTVVSRRVIARRLAKLRSHAAGGEASVDAESKHADHRSIESRIADKDEVQRLMQQLGPVEANVVRMYHLEGRSYQEISQVVGVKENSVGPMLSRARQKMRNGRP
ncbi:sigma-70 family RNA polymerase sigma factor [Rubripirellula lacrimiformis]|uniref:sigma-70 family RNA polymerase sigma factor n=1 Tax=Rubripirellula lacrimiformis TaxID=1930273 RepID=UPI00119DB0B5|nr:sigma-70 family RNA polymerase sigma factor [Rubripirellula lacrimiformis]